MEFPNITHFVGKESDLREAKGRYPFSDGTKIITWNFFVLS